MNETFGERFAKLRKEKGLTQEDIADRVNISAQAVSKWENDISLPDITTLPLLSEILGVSIDELLGKKNEVQAVLVEEPKRKNINKMVLRIRITSSDGDKVNINIPLAILKVCIDSGMQMPQISGNKSLSEIDFKEIYNLIEQGVIGELVSVDSVDGDHISIVVE